MLRPKRAAAQSVPPLKACRRSKRAAAQSVPPLKACRRSKHAAAQSTLPLKARCRLEVHKWKRWAKPSRIDLLDLGRKDHDRGDPSSHKNRRARTPAVPQMGQAAERICLELQKNKNTHKTTKQEPQATLVASLG
jgi:hypothetical protein